LMQSKQSASGRVPARAGTTNPGGVSARAG
jgi:hypothetical protein